MSGIDEQCLDIPECPICKRMPNFWILYPTMAQDAADGWYWLFSDEYIVRNTKFSKLTSNEGFHGRRTTLDGIVCIICSDNNHHKFVADHSLFQKVIQCSRRLER